MDEDIAKDNQALSPNGNADVINERKPQANFAFMYSPPPKVVAGTEAEVQDKGNEHSVRTRTFSVETGDLDAFDGNGNSASY